MPEPISLCIENVEDELAPTRFIRCVALAPDLPGLGIDRRGRPLWGSNSNAERVCDLWVSGDERLMLWRIEGSPPLTVWRARRSLVAPEAKPVVLLDQDEIELAGVRLRLHVHGPTTEVHAPTPLFVRAIGAAAIATAVAVGGLAAGCESRGDRPQAATAEPTGALAAPATSTPQEPSTRSAEAAPSATSTAAASAASANSTSSVTRTPPIEVRATPPKMPYRKPDAGSP